MTIPILSWQNPFAGTSRSRRRARFIPGLCKRRQEAHEPVLHQAVEYGSSGQSAIISGFQLSASSEKHPPPKPLPRQIPIDRQALTAFPRVRSSEAFRRRPPILG